MIDIAAIVCAAKLEALAIEQDGAYYTVTVAPFRVAPETAIDRLYKAGQGQIGGITYSNHVETNIERFHIFERREGAHV